MRLFFTTLLIISIQLLWPSPVLASLLISEVHPNPSTGLEWVELFNPSQTATDLTGWTIEDQLTTPSIAVPLTGTLEPQMYLAFDIPTAKLNNTVDGVTLKDDTEVIIDVMSYSSTSTGLSWSRQTMTNTAPFVLTEPSKNQSNPTPSPSPLASPAPLPSPSPSPASTPSLPAITDFHLSELQACPNSTTGDTEWLEVDYTGPVPLDLSGWQLIDRSGTTRNISTTFASRGLNLISWTGSLLNNTGDSFELIGPDHQTYLSSDFASCSSGSSLIWVGANWEITDTITKGLINPISTENGTPDTNGLVSIQYDRMTDTPASLAHSEQAPSSNPQFQIVPFADPATLHLTAQPYHPYASPETTITLTQHPGPPLRTLVSAILSSTLLATVSGYLSYDRLQVHHLQLADRLWSSLGLG